MEVSKPKQPRMQDCSGSSICLKLETDLRRYATSFERSPKMPKGRAELCKHCIWQLRTRQISDWSKQSFGSRASIYGKAGKSPADFLPVPPCTAGFHSTCFSLNQFESIETKAVNRDVDATSSRPFNFNGLTRPGRRPLRCEKLPQPALSCWVQNLRFESCWVQIWPWRILDMAFKILASACIISPSRTMSHWNEWEHLYTCAPYESIQYEILEVCNVMTSRSWSQNQHNHTVDLFIRVNIRDSFSSKPNRPNPVHR